LNTTMNQAFRIAGFDLVTALKTKKAFISIVVYVGLALLVAVIWTFIQNKVTAEPGVTEQLNGSRDEIKQLLTTKLGQDSSLVDYLASIPFAVMAFFWLTQTFLPMLISVISSDVLNREIRTRAARFVLLRASRTSLVLGKVMSHLVLLIVPAILSWIVFLAYVSIRLTGFDVGAAIPQALVFMGYTIVFGFCYLGLTALVSSLVDGAAVTVLVTFACLITLSIIGGIDSIGWISPSWYRYKLWYPHAANIITGLGAYLGFGLLFFAAAWQRIVRRDV